MWLCGFRYDISMWQDGRRPAADSHGEERAREMSAAVQRAVELRCFSFLRALLGTPAFARDAQRPLFVGLADELVARSREEEKVERCSPNAAQTEHLNAPLHVTHSYGGPYGTGTAGSLTVA